MKIVSCNPSPNQCKNTSRVKSQNSSQQAVCQIYSHLRDIMSFTETAFTAEIWYSTFLWFLWTTFYEKQQISETNKSYWMYVCMERTHILTWGSILPASILVFLTVNKWAGLQLAAHYWGAVVTHGRVPCSALWFRVTVDARDWRERKSRAAVSQMGGVTLLIAGSDQNEREQPGGEESESESGGIGKRSWPSERLWQQRSFNYYLIIWNMN